MALIKCSFCYIVSTLSVIKRDPYTSSSVLPPSSPILLISLLSHLYVSFMHTLVRFQLT